MVFCFRLFLKSFPIPGASPTKSELAFSGKASEQNLFRVEAVRRVHDAALLLYAKVVVFLSPPSNVIEAKTKYRHFFAGL